MAIDLRIGDCREVLRTLPAESVHCVVTSPPYFGLRDYGVAGQIGLEPTPDEYIAELVAVFAEVRRVLRKDGTVWLNLGDSYSSGGRALQVPDSSLAIGGRVAKPRPGMAAGEKPKDLLMIPARVALALQAGGWWLRSDIIWAKPNPMPESVTDRPTSAHEHVFLLAKSERYFFDADAVAEPSIHAGKIVSLGEKSLSRGQATGANVQASGNGLAESVTVTDTRNIRNVWTIATSPYPEAHFATFPPELAERCIKAGTSERGCCSACGDPWVRMVERGPGLPRDRDEIRNCPPGTGSDGRNNISGAAHAAWKVANPDVFVGWRVSCSCDAPIQPCTVLDPFAGAGTTGLVADRLQRSAILIELNPGYVAMGAERVRGDLPLFAEVAVS